MPKQEGMIIGLTGPAGCGKTTAADYLVNIHGFKEICFAGPIKRTVSEMFNIPLYHFHDRTLKETRIQRYSNKSPRELLQWFGTDIIREHFDRDFWLKRAFWDLEDIRSLDNSTNIVISDCRFENEACSIRLQKEGKLCHISRDDVDGAGLMSTTAKSHASENGILFQNGDRYITNNGTKECFFEQLDDILSEMCT